jgi:arylsulfatase A-like enzyme
MPPSFNEADVSDKPSGIRNLPLLTDDQIAAIREAYQQALEADLGVDDMVAAVVTRLKAAGELDNTLIIFTADNGFMYGEHRVPNEKVLLYEPSIRVPLVIRGPGVPKGMRLKQMVANIDLAPTIVAAAGAKPGLTMDGRSLFLLFRGPKSSWRAALVIERGPAGNGNPATSARTVDRDQVFVAIRTSRYLYAQYANGEQELYDLAQDPYELLNKSSDPSYARVRAVLARRLTALKRCAGVTCWGS